MFWAKLAVRLAHQANMSTHSTPSTIELPDLADADIDTFFAVEDLWAVIV